MSTRNQRQSSSRSGKGMSAGYMIRVSIFAAIGFVIMYLEFPIVALFPPFLQIDISEVIVFIGGITLGPVAVILIELLKNMLHLMLRGSTGGIGELANFLVGVALVLPPVVIYRKHKSFLSMIIGLVVGILSMVIIASLGNYFIFLPFYGVAGKDILGNIIYIYAPFNLVKGGIVALISLVVHQSIKGLYRFMSDSNHALR